MRALLLAAALAAPAAAIRPLTPPAPDFPLDSAWMNAKPLPLSVMRDRKVIVVGFINPTALHSLRAMRAMKAWFDRYALHQVMVIGVVTPELELQRDPAWVKQELERHGVEFPVVMDNHRRLWKAYDNEGWPTLYLIDRKGRIVFDQLGEGGYKEFERELRLALGELMSEEWMPKPVEHEEPRRKDCGRASPELLLGGRAKTPPLRLDEERSRRRPIIGEARAGETATLGRWDAERDGLRLAEPNPKQNAFVRVVFIGSQVFGVLGPGERRPTRFFVKLDDQWLHEGSAGADVRFDDDGRSYVDVSAARLFDLVKDDGARYHELYLYPDAPGAGVYGLSFADACLTTRLP